MQIRFHGSLQNGCYKDTCKSVWKAIEKPQKKSYNKGNVKGKSKIRDGVSYGSITNRRYEQYLY